MDFRDDFHDDFHDDFFPIELGPGNRIEEKITNAGQDEGGERGEGIGSAGVKSDIAILADPQTLVRPFPS